MSDPTTEFGDDDWECQFLRLVEEIRPQLPRDRIAGDPPDERETT